MGLFDKRNKVEKVVDADKLIQNEIKLLTHEEQCELVSGKKDDWGSREEHKISATPFAVANLAYQSSSYTTADGKPTTYAFSGSASSSYDVYCVEYAGDWDYCYPDSRELGAPPALSLIFDPKSPHEVREKPSANGKVKHVIKAGKYLNTNANNEQNEYFEKLFNNGTLQEGIKSTGEWATTSGISEYGEDLTPRMVSIFEIEVDGKIERWGRCIENPYENGYKYPDDTPVGKNGSVRWFKEEQVEFEVLNYKKVKNGTAKTYELKASEVILANMPYYPNTNDDGRTDFNNSTQRAWLNGIKTQGGDFTHTIKTLPNGEKIRCGYGSFLEDCFQPQEEFQHFEIPEWQTSIANYAYQANPYKTITIPKTVTKIGERAFEGTKFSYISKTEDGRIILSDKPLDWNWEKIVSTQNISKFVKTFDGFDIGKILNGNDLSSLEELANILSKNKCSIPSVFAEQLNAQDKLKTFVENVDFKFFKNEVMPFLTELNSATMEEKLDFYKFASALGCFSSDKILDKNGKETNVIFAQRASSFLAGILKSGVMPIGKYHGLFDSLPLGVKPDQDFLKFISLSGDKKFQNLDLLLSLENKNPGMFVKVLDNFDKAKGFRSKIDENPESQTYGRILTVPWEEALKKFYLSNKYSGVTRDNEDLAEVLSSKGISQKLFNEAVKLRNEAKESGTPKHILGKELKEETILESIERIKNDTASQLQGSKDLIESLFAKQFTYEMLDKYDPHNPIMGAFASCCGTIASSFYGKKIAEATVKAKDVQNLVVRNNKGEIIAKGSMYVNSQNGYAVINDFEINSAYKQHESGTGYYSVSDDNKEEQERELIFKAFGRGISAFVKEYDAQNPDNPMNFVNVGMGYNRLKKQTERFKKASQNLSVPTEYSFSDAAGEQRVLYDRKEVLKQVKANEGGMSL